jgi:hypothetical protein
LKHFNPLNSELNPICHLLVLLGAHHIYHVSGLMVNSFFFFFFFFHSHTVHTSNVLPQKQVYSRLPSSFVFSRGIFFTPPYLDGKFLNRSRLYVYYLIEYFTENTLSELRRSVIAKDLL